ncbi:hypothetical protein FS837_006742 [Tulasnella sp. UAMH 9824]|nr:hypothetical protein FS837_006742 [Tulasnella sp. UAMH 9824]
MKLNTFSSLSIAFLGAKSALAVNVVELTGPCDAGLTCVYQNDWYSQCLKASGATTTTTTRTATTTNAGSTPSPTGYFTNPIKSSNGSDPFMVYDGGYYYLMTTTWSNLQMTRATTIAGLKTATPKVLWSRDSVASRCCGYWAPEVHKINGNWWIYYTAGAEGTMDYQGVHVLKVMCTKVNSNHLMLPVYGKSTVQFLLLVAQTFIFSGNDAAGQSLFIAQMSNPSTVGNRYSLSQPTLSWEKGGWTFNEGPVALYHNGATYITYSASLCSTARYSLGLLKYLGGDPLNKANWQKSGPHVTSANGNYGPGHNGFVTTPGG